MIPIQFDLSTTPALLLDYDGVLHPDEVYRKKNMGIIVKSPGHTLFEHVGVVEDALSPYPEIKIVLSTSWVKELSFDRARGRLPVSLQERVIGSTWHSEFNRNEHHLPFDQMSRFQQIQHFVKRHNLKHWIAVDNDNTGWPAEMNESLVKTPDMEGLGNFDAAADLHLKAGLLFHAWRLSMNPTPIKPSI